MKYNMNLQNKISNLFVTQQEEWSLLKDNIKQLSNIEERIITWGNNINVVLQHNPSRIYSTSAKVDEKSIADRFCFLCEENRPTAQKGISFLNKYVLLCNPFPILKNHLTIPLFSHVPQLIGKKIDDMLLLAESLPDYIIFYNGAKSGASAPDHFHFQAGLKTNILLTAENNLRSCFIIESSVAGEATELFENVYAYLKAIQPQTDEPMMNIIVYTNNNKFHIHVFPRKQHRPWQYSAQGQSKLLISPGALDMAGLFIVPRKEDFNKISHFEVEDIYSQVSMAII